MTGEEADSVTWKGMKFTKVKPEGLLPFSVYIAEGSELIKDGKMLTEAEIAKLPVLQSASFGERQVSDIARALDMNAPPFVHVFVPDDKFHELTNAPEWAVGTMRGFPDGSSQYAHIIKDSWKPRTILPDSRAEWTTEEHYRQATAGVHEPLHMLPVFKAINTKMAIAEGLCEMIPKMILGYQHFMPENASFLMQLDKNGSIEANNKLHPVKELSQNLKCSYSKGVQASPFYGSAYLFMVGYFLELQEKLIRENPENPDYYKDDMKVLNHLVRGLSTLESQDATIVKMAEMVGKTPELLENSYYFQEKGHKWIRTLENPRYTAQEQQRRKDTAELKTEPDRSQLSVESSVRTLREAGISASAEPDEGIRAGSHRIGGKAGTIEKF